MLEKIKHYKFIKQIRLNIFMGKRFASIFIQKHIIIKTMIEEK
jgi:hypothetical protein